MSKKDVRIREAAASYMAEKSRKEEFIRNTNSKKDKVSLMESAGSTMDGMYKRSKDRVRNMEDALVYTENAARWAMKPLLVNLVENSLLLDEEEYQAINPEYKSEIEYLVESFLNKSDFDNSSIDDRMSLVLEYVANVLPMPETGRYLTEEEVANISKRSTPAEVNGAIDDLSGDVKKNVSKIVSDEQENSGKVMADVNDIEAAQEEAKAKNGIKTKEELAAEQQGGEYPTDENGNPIEVDENGNPLEQEIYPEDGEQTTELVKPKNTTIDIKPDGSVSLKIKESAFITEVPAKSLLESLAINEALHSIKEGKPYNPDLAIANSVMYITVLEAFSVAGLLPLTDGDYVEIIKAAGGKPSFK